MKRWVERLRGAEIVLAGASSVVAFCQAVAPDRLTLQIWIAAATPFAYLPALGLAVWALARRDRALGLAAAPAALFYLAWMTTLVWAEPAEGPPDLRVATVNALRWNESPEAVIDALVAVDADVVSIQEVSAELAAHLEEPALRDRWPHRLVHSRDDAFGIALLSRFPFDGHLIDLEGVPMIDADVTVDGRSLSVLAVHTLPPVDAEYARTWRAQSDALLQRVRARTRPLLVAGDLNATPFHGLLGRLAAEGLRDAHLASGRGLAATFPAPGVGRRIPPMLLDHVLVSEGLLVTGVREGDAAGSDHRPVVAELRWARAQSLSERHSAGLPPKLQIRPERGSTTRSVGFPSASSSTTRTASPASASAVRRRAVRSR